MNTAEITTLRRDGTEALRRGDLRAARQSFERLAAQGQADVNIWLGLAGSCGRLGDFGAAHAAVDQALALDAGNLRALLLKADLLADQGDARTASAFYQSAVNRAPPAGELTADLRADMERARALCERYSRELESHLLARLNAKGYGERPSTARFAHSLDLLLGRRQAYYQQPTFYYFPELPQVQFFDRALFSWLDPLEAATADIRAELLGVLEDKPDWTAFYLWKEGEPIAGNLARCPRTQEALSEVPFARVSRRSPSILFSVITPGAHIPPRNGFTNTRLICHLPLVVPGRCHLRVGNDVREWVEGKACVFDDTIEHEAWNRSDRRCVVLRFDIWRPELTEEERGLVSAMFEAVDAQGGQKPARAP